MSGENARVKSAWLMEESGGYGVIADATGATALFLPTEMAEDSFPRDERITINRSFGTSRNKRLRHRLGHGRGSFPLRCYAAGPPSIGTAGNPLGDLTWLDYILRSLMGPASAHDASAIGTGSTTTSLVTATNEMNTGDLVCLRGTVTNDALAQWTRAQGAASPITCSPALNDAPVSGDISYAVRTYRPLVAPNTTGSIGNTFSTIVDVDGIHYVLRGCRPQNFVIEADAGQAVMLDIPLVGDAKDRQDFASLPAAPVSDPDPMVFILGDVLVNGEQLDVSRVRFDAGFTVSEVKSSRGTNARNGWRVIGSNPRLEIDPLNDTDFEDLFNNESTFEVLVKFGRGDLFDSKLNTLGLHFNLAEVVEPPNEAADAGIVRKTLILQPVDAAASGYLAPYYSIGIA